MIREDMHVHSTFSDGRDSLFTNVERAREVGLERFGCVDHVRRDTDWLPLFVDAVDALRGGSVKLVCGVETKLLNQAGAMDMPEDLGGVDQVYVADHQFPLGDACYAPHRIRTMLKDGSVTEADLFKALVDSYVGALAQRRGMVIAHLFSILPKIGLTEADVPSHELMRLVSAAYETDAQLEIDERWRCPGSPTAHVFMVAGVPVIWSTDSHDSANIGQYDFGLEVARDLGRWAA